jgi:hypothetical protein
MRSAPAFGSAEPSRKLRLAEPLERTPLRNEGE